MCDSTSSTEQLLGDGNSRGGGDRCDAETKPEQCCMRWHLWMRPFAVTMYIVFVVFAVPWLVYDSVRDGFTRNDQLILVGGLCVLAAIPMSVWHIGQHMAHYTKPVLQKHIVRILWMVPIYALNAVSRRLCAVYLREKVDTELLFWMVSIACFKLHSYSKLLM